MAITLSTIASHTGFSRTTVGQVLQGRGNQLKIHAETQRVIREAASRLDYRKCSIGRALRTGKLDVVALVGLARGQPWRLERQRATAGILRDRGFRVHLFDLQWDADREDRLFEELLDLKPLGIVISEVRPAPRYWKSLQKLHRSGIPLVGADGPPDGWAGLPIDRVYLDREMSAYLAAQHLIELGHRQIACALPAANIAWELRARVGGFRRAMNDAGLPVEKNSVFHPGRRDTDLEIGYEMLDAARRIGCAATGMITTNDQLAIGFIKACLDSGIRVPQDLSIVGSEDHPVSRFHPIPITTLAFPIAEMAQTAVDLLMGRIDGSRGGLEAVRFTPSLVARESTAALHVVRSPLNNPGAPG